MSDRSGKEKRRYIRFDNVGVNFKTKDIGKLGMPSDIVESVAKNMSAEGICFRSATALKPGAIVELDILVPFQPRPAHLEGEVRWSSPVKTEDGKEMFDTGIRFSIAKNDETRFLMYMCEKMEERIEELEKELEQIRKA